MGQDTGIRADTRALEGIDGRPWVRERSAVCAGATSGETIWHRRHDDVRSSDRAGSRGACRGCRHHREGRAGSRIVRIRATQENTVSTVSDHGRRVTTTLSPTTPSAAITPGTQSPGGDIAKSATPSPQVPAGKSSKPLTTSPSPPPGGGANPQTLSPKVPAAKPIAPAAAAASRAPPPAAPKLVQPQPKGCPPGKKMAVVNGQPVC
jgi:hypothetical protein